LLGSFEIAEACLRFATLATRAGYPFDSADWLELAVEEGFSTLISKPMEPTLDSGLREKLADAIKGSKKPPLAAWVTAHLISTWNSKSFAAFDPYGPVYTLEDLQGFAVPTESADTLYGGRKNLSAQPGPDFYQHDPSAVNGLTLWHDEPLLHGSFRVTVDKTCAAQFDAAIGDDEKLKVALIQPNKSLLELSVTTVSPGSNKVPRFFGVGPRFPKAQTKKILEGLKLAEAAGAGIALLPELVMTEAEVNNVATALGKSGNIIPHGARPHTLRVVVSGSYHHVEDEIDPKTNQVREVRRNSTQVLFPRTNPMQKRRHSKSGKFVYRAPQAVMEAWKQSRWIFDWQAVFALIHGPHPKRKFREDIKASTQITLFAGAKFSVVVVICADLLNRTFRRVLETLQPSLVLVCNMTAKQGDFTSAAHALILACQSTLVSVNNPAKWSKSGGIFESPVAGGMAGLAVQDGHKRVIEAHVPSNKILIFDPKARELQVYPR
jgi:hypothetical protein